MLLRLLLLLVAAHASKSSAPYGLHINREANEALAVVVTEEIDIGWAVPADFGQQVSYTVRLSNANGTVLGEFTCEPEVVNCKQSDSVPLTALTGLQLPEASSFSFQIQIKDSEGSQSDWSAPFKFATALAANQHWPGGAVPIWSKNSTQNFVLFRRRFVVSGSEFGQEHLLHITAKGVPNRKKGGGANATKLLCAYKLWVNGVSISAGPGRPTGKHSTIQNPALLYDTVNITSLLRQGSSRGSGDRSGANENDNVIAIAAFYWNEAQETELLPSTMMKVDGDDGDEGGVLVLVKNTETGKSVVASGDEGWLAFDRGDAAMSPWTPPVYIYITQGTHMGEVNQHNCVLYIYLYM